LKEHKTTNNPEEKTMANLARTDSVFDRLFDFRRDFDDIFSGLLPGSVLRGERAAGLLVAIPPIEAWVDNKEKKYHLSVALAGIDPKDVQLSLQGNDLTVSGERKTGDEKKDVNYIQSEFSYERFERTIRLPEGVDTEKIAAQYNNGVLEITAPLSSSAVPTQIEIKSSQNSHNTKAAGAS